MFAISRQTSSSLYGDAREGSNLYDLPAVFHSCEAAYLRPPEDRPERCCEVCLRPSEDSVDAADYAGMQTVCWDCQRQWEDDLAHGRRCPVCKADTEELQSGLHECMRCGAVVDSDGEMAKEAMA